MKAVLVAAAFAVGVLVNQHFFLQYMDPVEVTKGLVQTAKHSFKAGCITQVRSQKNEVPKEDAKACDDQARRYAEELGRALGG